LRIMIDWTFALFFRPNIVKISLDSEVAAWMRALGDETARSSEGANPGDDGSFSEKQLGEAHPAGA
jgi:hypothetical protein